MKVAKYVAESRSVARLIFAVLVFIQDVDSQALGELRTCIKGKKTETDIGSKWTINCSDNAIIAKLRFDLVDLNCEGETHGFISISRFPLKNLCRVKEGTCFFFASTKCERTLLLPLTENCKAMYWTPVDDLVHLRVSYGEPKKAEANRFALVYEAYKVLDICTSYPVKSKNGRSSVEQATETHENRDSSSTERVLAIAFGCFCVLLVAVLAYLAVRSCKNTAKGKRKIYDPRYNEECKPASIDRSSERETVVNQLYEM